VFLFLNELLKFIVFYPTPDFLFAPTATYFIVFTLTLFNNNNNDNNNNNNNNNNRQLVI